MAHSVISGVLEQLRSILQTDQVNLLAGVPNESEKLDDTLSLIQAVVEDAEEKQVNNPAVKVWLEGLTRILYDTDDVLDEWNTRILSSQIQLLDAPISGDKQLQNSQFSRLNERLDRIVKNKALLPNLSESQSREEPLRSTSSFVDDSEIYGRVDDIYSIVSKLLSETSHQDSHVPLISIVGTGGFGKTTLVQLILKDKEVMKNFEKLMWVCVSKPFDLERVAKSIIKKATGDVPSTVDWEDLHECLSESVRGKKFLLVLDDVWTYDRQIWGKLKVSLDGGAQGSRIIITTRDENIAEKMASTYIHRLGQLSDEECWSFFKHIALREIQDDREKFEEIGKEIAWKCKGVPLAVKIIASLMRRKRSVVEWEEISKDVITRAWEGLLPNNHVLIYCSKHEIDETLATPLRNHIIFPRLEEKRKCFLDMSSNSGNVMAKKRLVVTEDFLSERIISATPKHFKKVFSNENKAGPSRKRERPISRQELLYSSKLKPEDASRKSLKDSIQTVSVRVSSADDESGAYLGKETLGLKKGSKTTTQAKVQSGVQPLVVDTESKQRIMALMEAKTSSITLEQIINEHKTPSTHGYSSKAVMDRTITQGKVEGFVEGVQNALQKLENGGSVEDAKSVCGPEILNQLIKWKNKLRVYLAPFLHGMRYTSFGRHFTKVDKLKDIVDKLHWYVQDGDMGWKSMEDLRSDLCSILESFHLMVHPEKELKNKKFLSSI